VPWCPDCDRFYNPNTLEPDGSCPTCGRTLGGDHPQAGGSEPKPEKIGRFRDEPTPWHFKVLVGLVSVYLSFRLVQGIVWVGHHA
jgi:hypothetical protein